MEKTLAKISSAQFGFGGYDGAMIGLSLQFSSESMGCGFFKGSWSFPPGESAKWTIESQSNEYADTVRLLSETLKAAKRDHVHQLIGTPVELTFEGMTLKSWRVLTEVI